jgi:hypothetical protein
MFSPFMTGKVVVQDSGAVTPRCSYQQLSKELGPFFDQHGGSTSALFIQLVKVSTVVRLPL